MLAAFQHLRFFLPIPGEHVESITSGLFHHQNFFLFLMRVLSHVIVTGFFLFLGMNMVFYERKHGSSSIYRHFLERAIRLFLLEFLITLSLYMTFALTGKRLDAEHVLLIATTFLIFALIFVLIPPLASIQWIRKKMIWIGLSLILIATIYVNYFYDSSPNQIEILLFGYGWMNMGVLIAFPLVPWLGITMIGYRFADWYLERPDHFMLQIKRIGFALLALFFIVRLGNHAFFNLKSDLPVNTIEDFFFLIKHPPSLSYLLFTGSLTLLFVHYMEKVNLRKSIFKFPQKILSVYSRNGIFFYVFHFYVYLMLIWLFFTEKSDSTAIRLLVWALGLTITYYCCLAFEALIKKWSKS